MMLSLYVSLFLIILTYFVVIQKSLDRKELALFLLISVFINSHAFTILMEINRFFPSKDAVLYLSFLFYRTIFTPILLTFYLNLMIKLRKMYIRVVSLFIAFSVFYILEIINISKGLYSYHNWTSINTVSLYFGTLLLYFVLRIIRKKRNDFNHEVDAH